MYVPELTHGDRLEGGFTETNQEIESLIDRACSSLQEAGLALWLFDWSRDISSALSSSRHSKEHREADDARAKELEPQVLQDLRDERKEQRRVFFGDIVDMPGAFDSVDLDLHLRSYQETRLRIEREKWARDELPGSWSHNMPMLHARSFLYAFDVMRSALQLLTGYPDYPPTLVQELAAFDANFPGLRLLRNSAHHPEQRAIGKNQKGRIELGAPPPWVGGKSAKAFVQSALINNRYGETLENGEYGELEISVDSLSFARGKLQRILDAYPWEQSDWSRTYP